MNTELKNAVKAADLKAQYDARVKRLVGHKRILAQILIKICARILLCPTSRFTLASYCAFRSAAFTAFFSSVFK